MATLCRNDSLSTRRRVDLRLGLALSGLTMCQKLSYRVSANRWIRFVLRPIKSTNGVHEKDTDRWTEAGQADVTDCDGCFYGNPSIQPHGARQFLLSP